MRCSRTLPLSLCFLMVVAHAQESGPGNATLTVSSTLVNVPALVKTSGGEVVFELQAADFSLTDNGIPQHLTLDPDTDAQPLALAICVETGGAGVHHLADYRDLDALLDALIGNVEHRVAVIGFDSVPHLLLPFGPDTDDAGRQLNSLREGDPGASILDGVAFAVAQLRAQPAKYRRAVLLLSETVDQGSQATLNDALRLISDTNTTVYSFGFSSTRSAVSREAAKFNRPDEPGPAHGCFSRAGDGEGAETGGQYSKQVLDCLSDLAPPIRLATMTFLTARNALHTQTASSIAQLTGGEFVHFHDAKELKAGLVKLSNDVPNYYVLSFHPTSLTPGLHALHLEITNRSRLTLKSRTEYWIDNDTAH